MDESEDIKELKKELSKLKPKEKLKRLKELGKKRKAEMADIEGLIIDSEKELKTDEVANEIVPEQEEINIGKLFVDDSTALESTVKKDAPDTEKEKPGYVSFQQSYSDYTKLQNIAYASMMGAITPTQMESVDKIGERLDRSKYHSQSAEIADMLVASRSTLYKIKKYAGVEENK